MHENIIVIPFRNRDIHLKYYIKNTVPLLLNHLPNSKVVVIEQTEGKLFNRGKLFNVVFKEYKNKTKYFIMNDVDINPTIECIKKYYIKEVSNREVLGIYNPPCDTLGGIAKITDSVVQMINGFPNDIWGWGTEDKALQNRTEFYKVKKIKNLIINERNKSKQYFTHFYDVNDRELKNMEYNTIKHYKNFNLLNDDQKLQEVMSSGLNDLEYTILERKMIHDMTELIKVEI
uniref:Galactosyltransferase C-terminal domain-containing protein n=1 Tax=viral metagenome TaxID=1070528 RepID=A0A6C0J4Q2_9ZZZZ